MNYLIKLVVLNLFICFAFSVDQSKFRKCDQAGFCIRHRDKPIKNYYYVDPSSINQVENQLFLQLVTIRPQNTPLTMMISFLTSDTIHVKVVETSPLDNRQRYEPDSILNKEAVIPQLFDIKEKTETCIHLISKSGVSSLIIYYNSFKLEFYVYNELKLSINDKNLFYFEVTRHKEAVIPSTNNEATSEDTKEEKEERTIVDYNEAGQPIYSDGTVGDKENIEINEDKKEDDSVNKDLYKKQENEDEKEDETGYWEESFGGHSDTKPNGPQSVGSDFTFHNVEFLYGIPEHATNIRLQNTRGQNAHYSEPYRLFNLDVFEYESDKSMALYGSIPLIMGLSPKTTVGFLWYNPSDTYIDVYEQKEEQKSISTQWMSEAGIIDIFFFIGPKPSSILQEYTFLTGTSSIPPYFSLGYHQSRWNYRDEEDVLTVHKKFEELNFPYDVIWLDIEHTDGKKYFTWDSNAFPDPSRMINELAKYGHRLVTIVDPHVKKESGYKVYEDLKSKDMFVKTNADVIYEGWCWPGASHYPDFTNENVRNYWSSCFNPSFYPGSSDYLYTWNDMNEPSVFNGPEVTMPRDNKNLNGYEQRTWHNVYGIYYHMANYNGQLQRSPKQRPFILTRSFFSGSQKYGAFWTGDIFSNWDHLSNMIPMLLNNGLAGYPFGGADIPGFFKDPESEELVVRWYQDAMFTPFFRAHAHIDTKRREPWTFSDETFNRLRNAIILRYSYLPYLYTLFYESSVSGSPIIRPLFYHYINDTNVYNEQQTHLIGRDLLVVPVIQQGITTLTTYIPHDDWYFIEERQVIHGGDSYTFKLNLDNIPILQRFGSIISRQMRIRRSTLQMHNDPYTLNIIPDLYKHFAEGQIYIDNFDGFEYQQGSYALMNIIYTNGTIQSTHVSGNKDYTPINTIERITVYLIHQPNTVKLHYQGAIMDLTFVYDQSSYLLTIRKPNVLITSEWIIEIN